MKNEKRKLQFKETLEQANAKYGHALKRLAGCGMSTSVSKVSEAMAAEVWFDSDMMHVRLLDGREIGVPIEWFPQLRNASKEQRKKWRLIGKGVGIHWEDIDEDISVATLLIG